MADDRMKRSRSDDGDKSNDDGVLPSFPSGTTITLHGHTPGQAPIKLTYLWLYPADENTPIRPPLSHCRRPNHHPPSEALAELGVDDKEERVMETAGRLVRALEDESLVAVGGLMGHDADGLQSLIGCGLSQWVEDGALNGEGEWVLVPQDHLLGLLLYGHEKIWRRYWHLSLESSSYASDTAASSSRSSDRRKRRGLQFLAFLICVTKNTNPCSSPLTTIPATSSPTTTNIQDNGNSDCQSPPPVPSSTMPPMPNDLESFLLSLERRARPMPPVSSASSNGGSASTRPSIATSPYSPIQDDRASTSPVSTRTPTPPASPTSSPVPPSSPPQAPLQVLPAPPPPSPLQASQPPAVVQPTSGSLPPPPAPQPPSPHPLQQVNTNGQNVRHPPPLPCLPPQQPISTAITATIPSQPLSMTSLPPLPPTSTTATYPYMGQFPAQTQTFSYQSYCPSGIFCPNQPACPLVHAAATTPMVHYPSTATTTKPLNPPCAVSCRLSKWCHDYECRRTNLHLGDWGFNPWWCQSGPQCIAKSKNRCLFFHQEDEQGVHQVNDALALQYGEWRTYKGPGGPPQKHLFAHLDKSKMVAMLKWLYPRGASAAPSSVSQANATTISNPLPVASSVPSNTIPVQLLLTGVSPMLVPPAAATTTTTTTTSLPSPAPSVLSCPCSKYCYIPQCRSVHKHLGDKGFYIWWCEMGDRCKHVKDARCVFYHREEGEVLMAIQAAVAKDKGEWRESPNSPNDPQLPQHFFAPRPSPLPVTKGPVKTPFYLLGPQALPGSYRGPALPNLTPDGPSTAATIQYLLPYQRYPSTLPTKVSCRIAKHCTDEECKAFNLHLGDWGFFVWWCSHRENCLYQKKGRCPFYHSEDAAQVQKVQDEVARRHGEWRQVYANKSPNDPSPPIEVFAPAPEKDVLLAIAAAIEQASAPTDGLPLSCRVSKYCMDSVCHQTNKHLGNKGFYVWWCENGDSCTHHKTGRCVFYHKDEADVVQGIQEEVAHQNGEWRKYPNGPDDVCLNSLFAPRPSPLPYTSGKIMTPMHFFIAAQFRKAAEAKRLLATTTTSSTIAATSSLPSMVISTAPISNPSTGVPAVAKSSSSLSRPSPSPPHNYTIVVKAATSKNDDEVSDGGQQLEEEEEDPGSEEGEQEDLTELEYFIVSLG